MEDMPSLLMSDVSKMREDNQMTRKELGGALFDQIANEIKVLNLTLL